MLTTTMTTTAIWFTKQSNFNILRQFLKKSLKGGLKRKLTQAGAELGQAQLQLELGFTLIA